MYLNDRDMCTESPKTMTRIVSEGMSASSLQVLREGDQNILNILKCIQSTDSANSESMKVFKTKNIVLKHIKIIW